MRFQKIRGIKRRNRSIRKWVSNNLTCRFDILEKYHEDHCDIVVHPWCDISLINSAIPVPRGATKLLMLKGLIEIYHAWKQQLNTYGEPYYLKIWLFEPRFELSRVMCAINRIKQQRESEITGFQIGALPNNVFTSAQPYLKDFTWSRIDDQDFHSNDDLGTPDNYVSFDAYLEDKKWIEKIMSRTPHTITKRQNSNGTISLIYGFRRGSLWVGEA
ncbi:hypothetical protein [Hymenobacter weizhouensis]|uniref:hypothetical protein n=1 Tax=Hymenobacter sp. YIM 151500-1 TaxID=2987689 RepID=UPI002226E465|nr:hypothetical protein [Hymenobacter sp. YIM 151500-1]UYZ64702.1 hypothetical protein OIS53_07595 [Hymenobacter sp. YIM 151500-1]